MATYHTEQTTRPWAWIQNNWNVLLKWKWTVTAFSALVFLGAGLFAFLKPPVYQATGRIWIENEPNVLPAVTDVQPFDSTDRSFVQSYYELLSSRSLAVQTIEKLRLYENAEFTSGITGERTAKSFEDPIIREKMIERFRKKVSVMFNDHDPRFATETLNAMLDSYIDLIVRQKFQASAQASEFLTTQIVSLREEIQADEKKLNDYGSEKDILPLTASEAPAVTRLGEVSKSLTEATIDRIKKYDYYNQIKNATPDNIPDALTNTLIQRLREQRATLSREYAKRLATVRPEYPEMQRLRSELDSTKEALQTETDNIINSAYTDYQASLATEQSLKNQYDSLKGEAFKNSSNSIVYNSLVIEITNKKNVLESLLKRQSETDLTSRLRNMKSTNVWIVDRADYPIRPAFPKKRSILLLGLLLGLAGGAGLALLIEYVGDAVRNSKDIANHTGLPTLGTVPSLNGDAKPATPISEFERLRSLFRGTDRTPKDQGSEREDGRKPGFLARRLEPSKPDNGDSVGPIELITAREPDSIQSESYRSIRTTLLVSSPPGKIKTILFTSPLAREGKSATVANLAVSMSQAGRRVVIVDSDLRRPRQNKIFEVTKGAGLTNFLSSDIDKEEILRQTPFENLFIVKSGPIPTSPIELLISDKMDLFISFLRKNFDYIFFDAPPVLVVSDAIAIGPMIDGVVLVARGGQTPIQALKQTSQKLTAHHLKCLGVIINGVNMVEQDGYYAKQYYHYYK
jgi:succinoglycan biosynthesis transport protein ExoP